MEIIKLTKDDIINNKMTLNKNQISYDTALVNSWESGAKTSFETLQNYNTKLNNREYMSTDDLKSYKSAMNSYIENNNRLRRLNKIFGQGYTDAQEKEWNDAITSLQSGYKEASDYFSQFKDENEYKETLAAIKQQETMRAEDVEAGMTEINSILTGEKLTALKEEKAILEKEKELSARSRHVSAYNSRRIGPDNTYVNKRLAELEEEIAKIEEPIMQRKEYLTQAKYLQNYFYLKENDVSLDELKSHLSDDDQIAYISPDGKNVTWQKLYDDKKYEQDLDAWYEKYSSLPDWDEYSTFVSKSKHIKDLRNGANIEDFGTDLVLEYIYGDDEFRALLTTTRYGHAASKDNMTLMFGSAETYGTRRDYDYGEQYGYDSLNNKETAVFTYLKQKLEAMPYEEQVNSEEFDALNEFERFMGDKLIERHNEKEVQDAYEIAQKYPVGSSLMSIGYNLQGGFEFLADAALGEIENGNHSAAMGSAIRQGISDKVDWEIGNFDAFDFLYNTAMSMADSLASTAILGKAGGIALGLSAAGQGVNDALDRGLSSKQAFWNGLASGTFEMIFETVSIGQFSALKESLGSGIKNIVKNICKSMLVNASEETLTEIANIVYDTVMNTDFSDYETKIRAYVASGMTPEEAERQVKSEMTRQVAEAAASGALMGLGFGGVGSISSHINAKAIESAYSNADINSLINIGLSAPDSKAYALAQQYQSNINNGKSLSAQEIVDLQQAVTEAVSDADVSKIKQAAELRLIELGERNNTTEIAKAITRKLVGEDVSLKDETFIKNSKYGERVLNEADPQNASSGEYASEWAKSIGTNWIHKNIYNMNLQSGADGAIDSDNNFNYNDNSIKEGESYNGKNTELLERGAVSAANRGNDLLWQPGTNSGKSAIELEISQGRNETLRRTIWAGESGWVDEKSNVKSEKVGKNFESGIFRRIRGVKLSGKDTVGGVVSQEILEKFKDTICKDEKGNLLSFYHWTDKVFDKFTKGEFGSHFGTLRAAYERYLQIKEDNPNVSKGIYKEVILNITNPIELKDNDVWTAGWVAIQLLEKGIIGEYEYNTLKNVSGIYDNTYNNPAAQAVREILNKNGYDGIIYKNLSEDAGSYSIIALYPEQIITVAENGVLKENSGVSRAVSKEEIASLYLKETQANRIATDEFIEGSDDRQYFDDGSGDSIPKSNVTDYKLNNISKKDYDKFFFKKPIKVSKKDWVKVDSARAQKYLQYNEDNIPDIDFFRIAEYNEINVAYRYYIRNYDKYSFEIVSKVKIKEVHNNARTTYTNTDANGLRHGVDSSGSGFTEYGQSIQSNDELVGRGEQSNARRTVDNGGSDSRREIDYNITKATSNNEAAFLVLQDKQFNEIEADEFIKGLYGEDSVAVTEQGEVLQPTTDGVIDSDNNFNYNDNSIKERESYNGKNTELLERGAVSATNRGDDVLRKQGTNSERLAACLEISQGNDSKIHQAIRAGESDWIDRGSKTQRQQADDKTSYGFAQRVIRKIQGVKLSGKDTIGGTVSPKILKKIKDTVLKDDKGNLISLYHWTQEIFEEFEKGEFGFHFGTLRAAYDRYLQAKEYNPNISKGTYKEVVLNITNPIELSDASLEWTAGWVAIQLLEKGIISERLYHELEMMMGFNDLTYDNPAAQAVRNVLVKNGYDGIIYENLSEDIGSYSLIALYPEQIITVAENGVLKENSGVSRAISKEEIASLYLKETQANRIATDEFVEGSHGRQYFDDGSVDEYFGNIDGVDVAHGGDTSLQKDTTASNSFELTEPTQKDIARAPTAKEAIEESITGKQKTSIQRHITDVCKKLDSNVTVEFVDKLKTNGKYIRSENKILIKSDLTVVQMYMVVFKHEFMHRLEIKSLYNKFFNYCYNKSVAFEQYVRTELKLAGVDYNVDIASRESVLEAYTNYKYEQYKNDNDIPQKDRDAFTMENAQEEIIADFFAQILFQGKKYRERIISALQNADGEALIGIGDEISSEAALMELQQKEPTLFEQVMQWFKDVINRLRGLPQAKSLVDQLDNELDYLEYLVRKAYQTKDSKRLMKKKLAEEKYSLVIKHTDGTIEELADARDLTDEQAVEYLNQAKKGVFKWNSYIPVRKDTPATIIETLKAADIVVENRSLVMQVRKAQQSMSATNNGAKSKKYGNNIRSHAMSAEQIVEIVNNLDNPAAVILQTNRYNQYGEELPDNVAVFVEYNDGGKEGVAIVEFDSSIDPEFIGKEFGDTNYHTVVTIFEPDTQRGGMPFDYIEELLSNSDNYELEIVRRQPAGSAIGKKRPNTSNELPSDFSISKSVENVKQDEIENHNSNQYSLGSPIQNLKYNDVFELSEPNISDIKISEETEFLVGLTDKNFSKLQKHIVDICKKLDSNITVEFVDKLEDNGKFIRSQNKILIRSDLSAVQMYVEVFKHEFMHRLETKQLYSKFFNYCFKKSKTFEQYVRAELKSVGVDFDVDTATRDGVLQAYTNYKYEQYKNSKDIPKTDRDAFTKENAQEEIIADFFAQILFQGKKYRERIISALQNADGEALIGIGDEISSEAALMELQQKEPTLFEQVKQWIRDIINKLRGLPQSKRVVTDLEYIESMLTRVYNSKDNKRLVKKKLNDAKYLLNTTLTNDDINSNIKKVVKMENVATLDGSEFAKSDIDLITQVEYYFNALGNIAHSKYGDIELNRVGIKASLGHGIGRKKAIAFKAIPAVLENGEIIDFQVNWKQRGYDTVVFAAPISILNVDYFMAAVVIVERSKNSYYLHEIALQKRENDVSFKTGTAKNGTPGDKSFSIHNLLQKLQYVKDNEIITDSSTQVFDKNTDSHDRKKYADNGGIQFNVINNESKAIVSAIKENVDKISDNEIFSVKSENVSDKINKSKYVLQIFEEQGQIANNKELGSVELGLSGAKSTVFHGFGQEKLAAVRAIKTVIENGNIIKKSENYNNSNVDRYFIAAKGEINNTPAYIGVIVKAYPQQKNMMSKFYLHEAVIIETDSPIMTAPQLSVDTVSESVSNNNIPNSTENVNIKENNVSALYDLNLTEPSESDYTRAPTAEESIASAISGEQLDTKQRRILDFMKKHFPEITLKFSANMTKNGLWDPNTKTILLKADLSVASMYIEVLKHEFMHSLESKELYNEFKNFLFNKDVAFGMWAKAQCTMHGIKQHEGATFADAINTLQDYYYNSVKDDIQIAKQYRDSFTVEGAQREMIADFFGDILFNGTQYRTQTARALASDKLSKLYDYAATEEFQTSSMEALAEIAEYKPNIFRQILDWFKNLILKLRGTRTKADGILADELEHNIKMLEGYIKRVYNSKDIVNESSFSMRPKEVNAIEKYTESQYNKPDLKNQEKDTHFGEKLYDTPQYLKPTTNREWRAFCRSFANKTTDIQDGNNKIITIFTADNYYVINAHGYMNGRILAKESIDEYSEKETIFDDDTSPKVFIANNEGEGYSKRNGDYDGDTFAGGIPDTFYLELDEFIERHPELFANRRESYADYKRRTEAALNDEVAFSMPIGKRRSNVNKNVIELSKDNELSKRIFGLYSTEKYKEIQKYIFDVLGGQNIVLSDGKKATVDKSDARHISQNAGSKKAAQISAIKELVEKAVLIAEEESNKGRKFDYFYYYEAAVKYDGEIFNIYLNVGRATNDKSYHLYDITQKLRDTAHRINGVGRPKPNEGYALKNGISNNIIYKTAKNVNNDYSPNTDNIGYERLNAKEQNYIQNICDNLGRTVVFEDLRNIKDKDGNTISPDGYVGKDGIIHLNIYAENPIGFVFKHELTHFAERSQNYEKFVRHIKKSNLYKNWLKQKTNESDIKIAEYVYKKQVVASQNNITSVKNPKAEAEMIADFVGEMLFAENGSGILALTAELDTKPRNAVVRFITDFISWIKKKLSGIKTLTLELSRLEDRFNELLSDAKNNRVDDNEVKFSIAGEHSKTANHSLLFEAKLRDYKGEDSESIRRDTGWYRGKDDKWRYYIPDNELNIDGLIQFANSNRDVALLGDVITHDKLFKAYPELRNVSICFDDIGQTKRGKFLSDKNEIVLNIKLKGNVEKIKDTLVHEIQHAIQYIEGFALGGNKNFGFVYAMNLAYDEVKNTSEFKRLNTKEGKYDLLVSVAKKIFNAENFKELRYKAYRSLYGEVEARQVTRNRLFNEELLKLAMPDTRGNVVDKKSESTKFVENFTGMGYTEKEILKFFRGEQGDESRSVGNIEKRSGIDKAKSKFQKQSIFWTERRTDAIGRMDEGGTRNDGRGVRSSISALGGISNSSANGFYQALDKSEWRVFYSELVKQGYIANTHIGTVAAIVVGNKLVIAERKYTAKDKHDYIVIAAYKLFSQDGDNYTLYLLQDALNKGDIDYDTQRIFSFVDRINRSYGTNELLTAYNRSNSRYDITLNNTKEGNGSSEIHRVSQAGIARGGLSLQDKPSIQGNDGTLSRSKGENNTEKATSKNEAAFSMQQNNDDVSYCFTRCFDEDIINTAEKMESDGLDSYSIWKELKAVRGIFGDWEQELDINGFKFFPNGNATTGSHTPNPNLKRYNGMTEGVLSDFVYWNELYEKYPRFKNVRVIIRNASFSYDTARFIFLEQQPTLFIDKKLCDAYAQGKSLEVKALVLRELQRIIQYREGRYIGKSLDYWKDLERRGKLPISQKLGRQLTAEDMMKYFIDNYEAELVAQRQRVKDVLKHAQENISNINDMIAFIPMIDPDEAITFNSKNKLVTVKENDNESRWRNFDNHIKIKYNEHYQDDVTTGKTTDEDTNSNESAQTDYINKVVETGSNAEQVYDFVVSSEKYSNRQDAARAGGIIKGGNSGFAEKSVSTKYTSRQRYDEQLYGAYADVPIADRDTIGRGLDEDVQAKLSGTFAKNENGEPLSFYFVNQYDKNLFKHAQLGLIVGTVNMAVEKFNHENGLRNTLRRGFCEEYYVTVKKPLHLPFEPYQLSVDEIGFYMVEVGLMTRSEYQKLIETKSAERGPRYDNNMARKLRERLKKAGYDSLVFENQNFDAGSMSVVIFDADQLIPVAKNGILIEGNGITDVEQSFDPANDMTDVQKENQNPDKLDWFLGDSKYRRRRKIPKPNVRIRVGSSVWMEKGSFDPDVAQAEVYKRLIKNSQTESSGYDTTGRELSRNMKKETDTTVFKTENGDLLSFFVWGFDVSNIDKLIKLGTQFKTFDSAFNEFVINKQRYPSGLNGLFKEFYINAFSPLVVRQNGWNTAKIADMLLEEGKITQKYHTKLFGMEAINKPTYNNATAKNLREQLKLLGYDSIIFIKDNGEKSVTVFDPSQIICVSNNGMLESDSKITQTDEIARDSERENYKVSGAVINADRIAMIDIQKVKSDVLSQTDNTKKLKLLTEYLECAKDMNTNSEDINVGYSGLLERGKANIWSALARFNRLVSDNVRQTPVNTLDTANRPIAEKIRQAYKNTVLKDSDGRLLSFFIWNKYGEYRSKHTAFLHNAGTLVAAHDMYVAEKQKHNYLTKGEYEEYYVNAVRPYFMTDTTGEFSPRIIAADMHKNGVFTHLEYKDIISREGADVSDRDSNSAKYLRQRIQEKGYDSLIYMNEKADRGSMGVIVLEPSQLTLVSIDGKPIDEKPSLDTVYEGWYNEIEKNSCRNGHLAGKKHSVTGVPFVKRKIEVNGKIVEVVAPEFNSLFDVYLSEELYMVSDDRQFRYCDKQLRIAIENQPELINKFTAEEIEQILNGKKLDNYTWHHDIVSGKMQLVNKYIHEKTGHTGGRFFWGGGKKNR